MRQSDIFSIIIIAAAGTLFSYFLVNSLLGDPNLEIVNVKTIQEISPAIDAPDSELFNPEAINPTVEVFVGECEDIDQNGILSRDELIACGKVSEDDKSETELVFCSDGTAVTDASLCYADNDELEQQLQQQPQQPQPQENQEVINTENNLGV
jgi:hypothetical protein